MAVLVLVDDLQVCVPVEQVQPARLVEPQVCVPVGVVEPAKLVDPAKLVVLVEQPFQLG